MKRVLYYCSSNAGKLREFALAASRSVNLNLQIEPLPGLRRIAAPPEEGTTFQENAEAKACFYSRFTSELVVADDSGLEVKALHGAPGVYSARFAGPNATDFENNQLLLARMAKMDDRSARFVCVLALATAGRLLGSFRGVAEGVMLRAPHGEEGFGYDPLFFYPPLHRSFGELDADQKFGISHRGHAFRSLIQYLQTEVPN